MKYPETYPGAFPPAYREVYHAHYHDRMQAAPSPRVQAAPSPSSDWYDCAAGYANWNTGWSTSKKQWCCVHQGAGCEHHAVTNTLVHHTFNSHNGVVYHQDQSHSPVIYHHADPYDCRKGFSGWQVGWSVSKQAWCCDNYQRGCMPDHTALVHDDRRTVPRLSAQYHCHRDIKNFRTTWSAEKRSWCCEHVGIGCRIDYTRTGHIYYNKDDVLEIENAMQTQGSLQEKIWQRDTFLAGVFIVGGLSASVALLAARSWRGHVPAQMETAKNGQAVDHLLCEE